MLPFRLAAAIAASFEADRVVELEGEADREVVGEGEEKAGDVDDDGVAYMVGALL